MLAATASAPADRPLSSAEATAAARQATIKRHAIGNLNAISLSCLVDAIVLTLFAILGTVGWQPVLLYVTIGLAMNEGWRVAYRRGLTLHLKDPHAPMALSLPHQALQLLGLWLMPQVGFVFLLVLFIVFTSLAMRAPVRHTALSCLMICAGVGAVIGFGGAPIEVPHANRAEEALAMAMVAVTMWRCIWIGTFNGAMTALLKKRSGELARLTREVERLAHHDELTGLPNRRSLLSMLDDECRRAERTGAALTVAMLDIDRFKQINDTFGHQAGDRALVAVAETVGRSTRGTDRFGRYGGEEFLMVLTHTDAQAAFAPIERFRDAMARRAWQDIGEGVQVTFSAGVACHVAGESVEDLIRRADDALYQAKRDGRNCTR